MCCPANRFLQNLHVYCLSPICNEQKETVEHILIECPAYLGCKKRLYSLWLSSKNPAVYHLILEALSSEKDYLLQFLLDCSVLPTVITASQSYGDGIFSELFYLTRTWCFSVHRERMKMLGRWNFQWFVIFHYNHYSNTILYFVIMSGCRIVTK